MGSGDPFEALSHPLRIEILKLLAKVLEGSLISRGSLIIESSGLLDFHLKKLDNLVSVNDEGCYVLNEKGLQPYKRLKPYRSMAGRGEPST